MKKLSLVIALFSIVIVNAQSTWNFDASHSSVRFAVDHMVVSEVEGKFTTFEGTVESATEDFSDAKINFKIDVNSVDTDNAKRDGHLKNEDFFDVTKHPEMTFESISVEKIKEGKYNLIGNLTLHGITKEITLKMSYGGTVKDPWGNTRAGLKVTGSLNRTDFGLKYNSTLEAGGLMLGEEVELSCKMELVKK
jgi:polyisoprenoid-binding protein YceI